MGHRAHLNLVVLGMAALSIVSAPNGFAFAQDKFVRNKTLPQSDRVEHKKVTFYNRLGITLVADLYVPKNYDRTAKYAALVVGTPFGAVKELFIVPNAGHVDLYDRVNLIPWDKLQSFFGQHLGV